MKNQKFHHQEKIRLQLNEIQLFYNVNFYFKFINLYKIFLIFI